MRKQAILSIKCIEITERSKFTEDNSQEKLIVRVSILRPLLLDYI